MGDFFKFLWPSQKNSTLYIRTRLLLQKGYCCGEHHLSRRLLVEFSKDFKSWLIKSVFNIWNISISYYGISQIKVRWEMPGKNTILGSRHSQSLLLFNTKVIESVHLENLAEMLIPIWPFLSWFIRCPGLTFFVHCFIFFSLEARLTYLSYVSKVCNLGFSKNCKKKSCTVVIYR